MSILKKLQRKKKRNVYMVFLFSYISILLLTLSSSFVYYLRIYDQITSQTEATKQVLLTNLRSGLETSIAYVKTLSNEIVFNSKIEQFAKGIPSLTAGEVMKEISFGKQSEDILFDYFLYIRRTDEIITPSIRMKSRNFFDIMYSFEHLDYETFQREYLDTKHFQHYFPIERVNQYDSNPIEVLPFLQTFPVGTKQEPLGQMICFINAEKIYSQAEQLHQATGSDIYILDENDQLILSSGNAAPLDISLVSEISGEKVTSDAILLKQVSDTLGWKFVISTPKSLFFKENREFLLSILIISGIYLAVGLILVRFLAEHSYRPIREISGLISPGRPRRGENEYDTIKITLIEQMRSDKELNATIDALTPIARKEMLNRLLSGMVTDYEGISARLEPLGVQFESDWFLTVSMEIDPESPFLADGPEEQGLPLARLILQNIGCELLGESFRCYYLDFDQTHSAFLLNILRAEDIEHAPERAAAEIIEQLIASSSWNFRLRFFAGVSSLHQGLQNTPVCFDEARKASDYCRLRGGPESETARPVCFNELEDLDCDYYFPSEMEYRLVGALKSGDYELAKKLITNILDLNARQKGIGTGAARRLLFEISSTLQKLIDSTLLAQGKNRLTQIDLDGYWKSPNLQTARLNFFDLIDRFAEQQAEMKATGKTARLAEGIGDYIREHIGDGSLDLNSLSREFNVTPQYISNIFKRYQNENVKDYISKLRLERAKKLLCTTDLPVREIAAQLGYAGEIGIIRLFKKYEGTTPGDYRSKFHG